MVTFGCAANENVTLKRNLFYENCLNLFTGYRYILEYIDINSDKSIHIGNDQYLLEKINIY